MQKRKNILIFIAAAALFSSLCGIFFYPQKSMADTVSASKTSISGEFSAEDALSNLNFCSLSYDKEALGKEFSVNGYGNFIYYERSQDTNTGSGIAFGIASKNTGEESCLMIVFRGTHKGEWYSNFQIGESTEHSGFSAAADYAVSKTEDYIRNNGISKENTNLYLTGHSRGGAVANIIAKRLIDEGTFKEITAYTFASPNTTTAKDAKDKRYTSIYNIINPEDFICYIPLHSWDYTKYGTDITLPCKGCENYSRLYEDMEESFFESAQRVHTGYPDGDRDVVRFLENTAKIAPTVYDYYQKEFTLFPSRVSLYEYMQSAAALLSGENSLSNGMILLSGTTSPMLSPLTEFLMQGISIEEVAENPDFMSSAVGSNHSYETYKAWLNVLDENYFAQYLNQNN